MEVTGLILDAKDGQLDHPVSERFREIGADLRDRLTELLSLIP